MLNCYFPVSLKLFTAYIPGKCSRPMHILSKLYRVKVSESGEASRNRADIEMGLNHLSVGGVREETPLYNMFFVPI